MLANFIYIHNKIDVTGKQIQFAWNDLPVKISFQSLLTKKEDGEPFINIKVKLTLKGILFILKL